MATRNEASGSRSAVNKQAKSKRKGSRLPEQLPAGKIVADFEKKQWRLGKSIGVGEFAEIYSASDNVLEAVPENAEYVVKIEPHENGSLFAETHFYIKACKPEMIEDWKSGKKLKFIGVPRLVSFGSQHVSGSKYRFIVMDRFGVNIQRIFEANKNKFSCKTAFSLAAQLLDVLEYIHSTGYVHADIRGSNLLLGYRNENEVYLVDYGSASKYVHENKHKVYVEIPGIAHDGTTEFISRGAHVGAHSRKGDLESLAYNVVQWLCSRLPWEDYLKDQERVYVEKNNFMNNLPQSLNSWFGDETPPECLATYLRYVARMDFQQEPDYNYCRHLFVDGIRKAELKIDAKLDLKYKPTPALRKTVKPAVNDEYDDIVDDPVKRVKLNLGSSSKNFNQPSSRKVEVKSRSEELLKSKRKSASSNSLNAALSLPVKDIPTPTMLHVMKLRERKHRKTNYGKASQKPATAAAPSDSDESSQE